MRLVIDLQGAQGCSQARGIGRYSRELALAMAAAPRGHEVIIALSGGFAEPAAELAASFKEILPRSQIRLWHPPADIAASRDTRLRGFAEVLRAQFLAALQPDLVHVSSLFEGLGDDVVTLQPPRLTRLPVVCTCYDLIPLVRHDAYFGAAGPLSQGAQWYYRCVHEMAMSEGLLAISESSRGEAIRHLSFDPTQVFNIQSGISPDFQPCLLNAAARAAFLQRYGLRGDFILFLGAGDIRKNEAGLIAAYASLPPAFRDRYQLLIVGKMDPATLYQTARALDVPADDFVIVPFVPEEDLNALYSACALFVFPSLHEGFGLPVAEAMACGAPVIASNTTSLPEVIGRADATFDPADPDSISSCMRKALENTDLREDLAKWGPIQAARFTWPATARRAWDALEAIHARRQHLPNPVAALAVRPRLAFVAPFPPQATGIADYSYELIFSLARHYDITIVTQADLPDARLSGAFPLLRPEAFLRQASGFDRVLYQIGNSHFHRFQMEDLLPQCPGVVVLHDAFLADYAHWLAHTQGDPDQFRAILLHSHGYKALRDEARDGSEAAKARYPCSLKVLQSAVGVIQHSRHGAAIVERFFGAAAARNVAIIPHLRAARPKLEKPAARALLGLDQAVFLVCSFGEMHALKCPDLIAEAWRRSKLAGKLVFAGWASAELAARLTDAAAGIDFTGRLSLPDYDLWLAAADIAVQWRTGSRGESSGAVADVLMAGLPLIYNRHGAAAEMPESAGLGLPDEAGAQALADAMLALHGNLARRQRIADAGYAFARQTMRPELAAARYVEVIEHAYAQHSALTATQLLAPEIRAAATAPGDLVAMAKSLSRSLPAPWHAGGNPRLLVDFSGAAMRDSGSASARLAREIGRRILEAPPPPYRAIGVRAADSVLLETFAEPLALLGHSPLDLAETPLDAGQGDILICAGADGGVTQAAFAAFRQAQLEGARIILVVPESFLETAGCFVPEGYRRMLGIADGAGCVSNAVAGRLMAWLDEHPGLRRARLPIGCFNPGAGYDGIAALERAPAAELQALALTAARPTILLTGTCEPWEGYAQALDAFELLWRDGGELGLTLVGQPGRAAGPLLDRLAASPERGWQLHWLPGCSEAVLGQLYRASSGLLMAATDDGFCLPMLEAAAADLPILVRDLPAFREIAAGHARYFCAGDPEALAVALREWQKDGFTPWPSGIARQSWDDSYRQFCELVLAENYPLIWRPKAGRDSAPAAKTEH